MAGVAVVGSRAMAKSKRAMEREIREAVAPHAAGSSRGCAAKRGRGEQLPGLRHGARPAGS